MRRFLLSIVATLTLTAPMAIAEDELPQTTYPTYLIHPTDEQTTEGWINMVCYKPSGCSYISFRVQSHMTDMGNGNAAVNGLSITFRDTIHPDAEGAQLDNALYGFYPGLPAGGSDRAMQMFFSSDWDIGYLQPFSIRITPLIAESVDGANAAQSSSMVIYDLEAF